MIRIALLLGSLVLLSCAPKQETPRPINKTLSVEAGPNVNQYNESANPIVVRLYQLSSRSEFEDATFWEIFEGNAPNLAGVVLDKRSLSPLLPGETRLVAFDLVPDTFYLAAFAEFAEFETQQFRDVVPISAETLDNGVTVSVTASGISIELRNPGDGTAEQKASEPRGLGKVFKGLFGKLGGGQ